MLETTGGMIAVFRRDQHLHWLDWVRFLAAAVVVCGHVCGFNWDAWPERSVAPRSTGLSVFLSASQTGRQAVVVFFVLSGLLVGGKVVARMRTGTFDAAAYAADRLARVYVPLIPAVLLTMAAVPFSDQPWSWWPYLRCLTGTQEVGMHTPSLNAPLWTLAYEIWFYVLAGCVAMVCRQGDARWRKIAASAGVAVSAWMFWKMETAYLFCWLLGAAGFWLRDRVKTMHGLFAAVGGCVVLGGTLAYQMDFGILAPIPGLWVPSPYPAQVIVAAGALLLVASLMSMAPASRTGQQIERGGTTLAAFSYTLYLTHYPVVYLLALRTGRMPPAITWGAVTRGLLWAAVCVVVALIMYALFEARTPSVRRWLRVRFGVGNRGV